MHRSIVWISVIGLIFALGCSGDDAENAASKLPGDVSAAASDIAEQAGGAASDAASALKTSAIDACRTLAEQGAWGEALDVCKKAHEMMPDDMGLEHAYQQAKAAAAN